jgi:hypothetical protein
MMGRKGPITGLGFSLVKWYLGDSASASARRTVLRATFNILLMARMDCPSLKYCSLMRSLVAADVILHFN